MSEEKSLLHEIGASRSQKWARHSFLMSEKWGVGYFLGSYLVVFLILLMMGSGRDSKDIPFYKTSELAKKTVRVNRAVELVDEEETENAKEQIANSIPDLYVYKSQVFDEIKNIWKSTVRALSKNASLKSSLTKKLGIELSAEESQALFEMSQDKTLETTVDALAKVMAGRLITKNKLAKKDIEILDAQKNKTRLVKYQDLPLLRILTLEEARGLVNAVNFSRKKIDPSHLDLLIDLHKRMLKENLVFQEEITHQKQKAALENFSPVMLKLVKGEVLVREGERVSVRAAKLIAQMHKQKDSLAQWSKIFTEALLGALLLTLLLRFLKVQFPKSVKKSKDLWVAAAFVLASVALTKISLGIFVKILADYFNAEIPTVFFLFVVPVASSALVLRLLLNQQLTLLFSVVFGLSIGVLLDHAFLYGAYVFCVCLAGQIFLSKCRTRNQLYTAGLWLAVFSSVSAIVLSLVWKEQSDPNPGTWLSLISGDTQFENYLILFSAGLGGFMGGILSAALALVITPLLEQILDYTTDLKLLELARMDHPLLKDLVMKAPGTYHHSMVVGSLAEAGCDAIGANSLLARVGSYYHDIGKIPRAEYFVENQTHGVNKHDQIRPQLSAKIIISHVKDGVAMAEKAGLGQRMIDFIEQHHGKSLVHFFYNKAKQLAAQAGEGEDTHVDETDFRYSGPKPQTKETAIVCMADACEAATRSLVDPTPARLESMVHKIVEKILNEGTLDEADITLREVKLAEKAYIRILLAIYHNRIQYPDQEKGMPASGKEQKS